MLRAEAHRLAVLLAVVEQIALIAFEHGPRDLDRIGDAALLAPLEEGADVELTIADRVLGVVLDGEGVEIVAHQRSPAGSLAAACCLRGLDDAGHHLPPAMVRT